MIALGARPIHAPRLGQWGDIFGAIVQAGTEVYKVRTQAEIAEDRMEFEEAQAARAAAREAEAQRIQQEALKAINEQKTQAAAGPAAAGGMILGMQPQTFYVVAGLGIGAVVLLGMFMMKGK